MSGIESTRILRDLKQELTKTFDERLCAIIVIGSAAQSTIDDWSDIDLIIVLEHLTFPEKLSLSKTVKKFERTHKIAMGVNAISLLEYIAPKYPINTLDGKTIQGIIDAALDPKRYLFHRKGVGNPAWVEKGLVRSHSLLQAGQIKLIQRRNVVRGDLVSIKSLQRILLKSLKLLMIIARVVIQYSTGQNLQSPQETAEAIKRLYPKLNTEIIKSSRDIKRKINKLKRDALIEYIAGTDELIEEISKQTYEREKR